MAVSDAISIFAEGTFEEQILELVHYLSLSVSEDERPAYVQPFSDLLVTPEGQPPISEDEERQTKVFSQVLNEVKGFGEGSDKEAEGFFNLLFAHFLALFPLDASSTKDRLADLLNTIASAEEQPGPKYRVLSNLFNTIPRTSGLRLLVQKTLVEIASTNDNHDYFKYPVAEVEKWLSEWDISQDEKSDFLVILIKAFTTSGDLDAAYKFKLSYARSLPTSSPLAEAAATDAIASSLRLPDIFDFDPLLRIDVVVAAKDHELFPLLHIFLNDVYPKYKEWLEAHPNVISKYDLDATQLERKIRLLSLATLGFQNIGRSLSYSTVASALQVSDSDVEKWVIDAIRAGLITSKLSQTTRSLHIIRATARAFDRSQWEVLEKRLVAWQSGLASILDVVASTKKRNAPVVEPPQTNGVENGTEQNQETAS